ERPKRIDRALCATSFGTGRTKNRAMNRMPRKTPRVLNWRFRYAAAPVWIAFAISFIFGVPSGAASTSRRRYQANARATNEIARITHSAPFSNGRKRALNDPASWARNITSGPPTALSVETSFESGEGSRFPWSARDYTRPCRALPAWIHRDANGRAAP